MKYYIGIDVAKKQLDVDWMNSAREIENEPIAIEQMIGELLVLKEQEKLELIICEATGGYEQKLVRACHEASLPIHVAHANKVRHFAKSTGTLAKTDKLDARVLSEYGRLLQPQSDSLLLNKTTEKIAELLKRREQLQADRKREQSRLDKLTSSGIIDSVNSHIDWLDNNIKNIEKELKQLRKTDEVKQDYELLTSIPAIGDIVALYLLVNLPELGKLSNKALSALVGVAPFNYDSGSSKGKRFIQGGRSTMRRVLYMAAITAIQFNMPLKTFYNRLKENGKPTKVALTAVIRKLITMANSVLKREAPWEQNYQKI